MHPSRRLWIPFSLSCSCAFWLVFWAGIVPKVALGQSGTTETNGNGGGPGETRTAGHRGDGQAWWGHFTLPVEEATGPAYRKIGLNGAPLPDKDPAQSEETDQAPERSYVDALNHTLHHDVSDIHVPLVGGQLALTVRRSVESEVWSLRYGLSPEMMPDRPFGNGWSSSLTPNVHVVHDVYNTVDKDADYVFVTDENGMVHRFLVLVDPQTGQETYFPLPTSKVEQDTFLTTLTKTGTGPAVQWIFKQRYGTILVFGGTPIEVDVPRDATYQKYLPDKVHTYYRVNTVTDRYGSRLSYTFNNGASLTPDVITSSTGQSIAISKDAQGHVYAIRDPRGNSSTFSYSSHSLIDNYNVSRPYWTLDSVTRPSGATTRYTYQLQTEADPVPSYLWAFNAPNNYFHLDVASIQDPNGNTYRFQWALNQSRSTYDTRIADYYPMAGMPCNVTSVTLPDGTQSRFVNNSSIYLTPSSDDTYNFTVVLNGQVATSATDTGGSTRTYNFTNGQVILLNTFKPYIAPNSPVYLFKAPRMVVYQTMTITGPGGQEVINYDLNAGLAVSSVRDLGGNTTAYRHTDTWSRAQYYPSTLAASYYPFGAFAEPTRREDASDQAAIYTYGSPWRLLTRETDEQGRSTDYTLDPLGRTTTRTLRDGAGVAEQTDYVYGSAYAAFPTRVSKRNFGANAVFEAGDIVTSMTADAYGNAASRTVSGAGTTRYNYDANNNKLSETDPRGNTTAFDYDADNRLTHVRYADGSAKILSYDAVGNKVRERDENGHVTTFDYDGLNRLTSFDREGCRTRYTYNGLGSRTAVVDPNGQRTQMAYDGLQRLTRTVAADGANTTYAYSGGDLFDPSTFKPTLVTDPRGFFLSTTYDGLYRPTRKAAAYQSGSGAAVTLLAYDGVGNVTATTDPNGNITQTAYDARNLPTTILYADQTTRQLAYTSTGLKCEETDELGRLTQVVYDAAGRPTDVYAPAVDDGSNAGIPPVSPCTHTDYDAAGNAVAVTDPLGRRWDHTFDKRNRRTRSLGPAVTDAALPAGSASVRPRLAVDYDSVGNVVAKTDARGARTTFVFDGVDRLTDTYAPAVPLPDGTSAQPHFKTEYDSAGNVLKVTDPNGHVTVNTYDACNRLLTTTDAAGNTVTNTYDLAGNLVGVTDGNGQPTLFGFDGLNRNVSVTDAANQTTTFTYDGVNKTARVDALGQETIYGYDRRNRLIVRHYPGSPLDNYIYSLDLVGNILAVFTPENTVNRTSAATAEADGTGAAATDCYYVYDALNRVVGETSHGKTHAYRYDLAGNRVAATYGATNRVVTSTYDALNRLATLEEEGRVSTYRYDLTGNAVLKPMANSGQVATTFDALNRSTRMETLDAAGGTLSRFDYTHDPGGNLRTAAEYYAGAIPAQSRTLDYDAADRLTAESITVSGQPAVTTTTTTFGYDAAHNRAQKAVAGGVTTTYHYNTLNQLTDFSDTGGYAVSFTYDANGNRTTRTQSGGNGGGGASAVTTTGFGYDVENRLVSVSGNLLDTADQPPVGYAVRYDYRTRRVELLADATNPAGYTASTAFVFSGGQSVAEYALDSPPDGGTAMLATSPTVEYIRGSDWGGGVGGILYSLRGGAASFALYDGRGDVTGQVDASGVIKYAASYEAWGGRTKEYGINPDPQRANSKDELLGLLNEGQRYRDLESGTFLTRDPLGFVDGPNLYAYVRQNPWSKFDPEGLEGYYPRTQYERDHAHEVAGPDITLLTNPRVQGGLKFAGGTGEALTGGALLLAPEPTMASKVLGGFALGHGLDVGSSGWNQMVTGQPTQSLTSQAVEAGATRLGADPATARNVAEGTDAGMSAGLGWASAVRVNAANLTRAAVAPTQSAASTAAQSAAAVVENKTLTVGERAEFQAITDKYNTTIDVVGSRAAGKGRNIDRPELPIGKGPGARSDIDTRIDTTHPQTDEIIKEVNKVGGGAGNASRKHSTADRPTNPPFIRFSPTKKD